MNDKLASFYVFFIYGTLLGCVLDIFFNYLYFKLVEIKPTSKPSLLLRNRKKEPHLLRNRILGKNLVVFLKNQTLLFPWTELLMGLLFALNYYYYGLTFEFFSNILFIILVFLTSIICLIHMIIPLTLTFPGIILGFLFSLVKGGIEPLNSIFGILLGGGTFMLIYYFCLKVIKRELLGQGTIWQMAMIGAFLGPEKTVLAMIFFSLLLMIIFFVLWKRFKNNKNMALSAGDLQGIGALISLFCGNHILSFLSSIF